jgi:serine protease Do
MKKLLLFAAVLGCTTFSYTTFAQKEKQEIIEKKEIKEKKELKEKKESQEIIIRRKGDKDTKITVEIKGDNVTINGKPISDFKDGDITINKRNIRVWDGKNNFAFAPDDMDIYFNGPLKGNLKSEPRAFLGVTSSTITDDTKEGNVSGAEINKVSSGSAAEKAGLKNGDIITKINDKKIDNPGSLSEAVASFKPKDEVTVYYKRDGKENSAKAVLGETKSSDVMAYSFTGPNGNMRSFTMPRTPRAPQMPMWNAEGMEGFDSLEELEGFGNIFPRHQKLGLKIQDTEDGNGVKVLDTEKDSPAEKAGLKKDDIVTEIGGKKISTTDDAREQLMENAEKASYNIKAKRNGSDISFDIKISKKLKTVNL